MLQNAQRLNWWDKMMMAATFAEANEAGTARDVLTKRPATRTRKESVRRPELRV